MPCSFHVTILHVYGKRDDPDSTHNSHYIWNNTGTPGTDRPALCVRTRHSGVWLRLHNDFPAGSSAEILFFSFSVLENKASYFLNPGKRSQNSKWKLPPRSRLPGTQLPPEDFLHRRAEKPAIWCRGNKRHPGFPTISP